jgi:hypothetical protein
MNDSICRMSELRASLEYIPLRTNPERGLSLPGLPDDNFGLEEAEGRMDTPGPLMSFVLSLGQYFTAGALFAAVALMLMVAGA